MSTLPAPNFYLDIRMLLTTPSLPSPTTYHQPNHSNKKNKK